MSTPDIRATQTSALALSLLVSGIGADDSHRTLSLHDFTFVAAAFDRSFNLHVPVSRLNLLETIDHPAPSQIIRREFHPHRIAGENLYEMPSHAPRDVGQHHVPIRQLHAEHGVGQALLYLPLDLYPFFLCHTHHSDDRQYLSPAIGHGDGVLEMRRKTAIGCDHRPLVV